MKHDKKIC